MTEVEGKSNWACISLCAVAAYVESLMSESAQSGRTNLTQPHQFLEHGACVVYARPYGGTCDERERTDSSAP